MIEPRVIFRRFAESHQAALSNMSDITVLCILVVAGVSYVLLGEDRWIMFGLLSLVAIVLFYGVVMPAGRPIGDWDDQLRKHGTESETSSSEG